MGEAPRPSLVVIFLPVASETGVLHERTGLPSTCTVQAPQRAIPQPNLVPVRPRVSRSTQSSGVVGSASTLRASPLMSRVIMLSSLRTVTGALLDGGSSDELLRQVADGSKGKGAGQSRAQGRVRLAKAVSPRSTWK